MKKYLLLVAAAALGVGGTAFFPAHAASTGPSTSCTDGYGTETMVVGSPVYLAVEHTPNLNGTGETHTLVCWSTTPRGSTAPEASGGRILMTTYPDGRRTLQCNGDRTSDTVVTVDCTNTVTPTDPKSSSVGATFSGYFKEGTTSPVVVGQTGAELGTLSAGNATPYYAVSQTGSCVWVAGSQLLPGCTSRNVELKWNQYDTTSGTSGTQCVVMEGTTCRLGIPKYYVVVGKDTTNPSLDGTVLDAPVRYDITYTCVGFC